MGNNKRKAVIVMDNGGGCTLILGKTYQHCYDDMAQARHDAEAYEAGEDTSDWDGNEIADYPLDIHCEDYYNQERNGGYRTYYSVDDIDNNSKGWDSAGNVIDFRAAKKNK
jgi:hypothetical protein